MRLRHRPATSGGAHFLLLAAVLALNALSPTSPAQAASSEPADVDPGSETGWTAPRADGVPSVSLGVPATVFIGESFPFTVTFDNTSATDTGYGPFVDLLFPVNGADGAAGTDTPDGIDFVSATYLGAPLTAVELTFPGGAGCVNHPYARDTSGAYVQVCGTAGDKLVVLLLPFGSFTPTQPAAVVTVNATLSNLADGGTPLTLRARGGFRFGSTPLDDWCCDPVILQPSSSDGSGWPSSTITPTLLTIAKAYGGPEDETATGPNYPRQYTITVTVAPGQTVTDLDVKDELPNNLAFLSIDSFSPAGSVIQTPTVGAAANPPNNRLVVNFPSVTGTATVTFSYFVPLLDANGTAVVPAASGDDATSTNRAGAVGDWDPVDPRDAGGADNAIAGGVCPACAILHTLNDRSIAIQKGVAIINDTGAAGASPGDTLQYTLSFQVSDFFAFDHVVLSDTVSDGQRYDGSFTPTLAVGGNGFSLGAAAINAANFDVEPHYTGGGGPPPTNGTTILRFRASDELITRGQASGRFIGGCIPTGGTGGPLPDCTTYNDGPTTGTIVFRSVIQDNFTDDYPSLDPSVDQGDVLDNGVTIDGRVLNVTDLLETGSAEDDGSGSEVTVPRGTLDKTIYAVNGSTSFSSPVEVDPGDTLTFRLRYGLPTSDFEDLSLTDFLPLPVLYATEVTTFDPTVSVSAPSAGTAKFGPLDTFYASNPPASNIVPSITTSATGNSVTFTYGDYDDPANPSTEVDILFTVTVSNDPFTDQLLLTNQLRVHEGSTNATDQDDDGIVQFILREPFLVVKKGVIATDNSADVFTPPTVGPVGFSGPGTAGTRFGSTIDSNGLTASPVDSDVADVDAADLVSFAITLENQGSSPSGAFDIVVTDTLPAGFIIPGGVPGLNLTVTRGDGSAVSYLGAATDLFGPGIELVDPGSGPGVCEAHNPTSGRNIIVITYDLQIDPSAEPEQVITDTAEVINYAGEEGGEDHTGPGSNPAFQDEADVTIASPTVVKTVIGTNQAHTLGLNVAIGEFVQYQAVTTIPEGTMTAAAMVDTLDSGLAFVSLDSLTASPALSTDVAGGFAQVLANAQSALASPGSSATFVFGTLTNSDTDDDTDETVTLTYTVVVLNSTGNNRGVGRNNSAAWTWSEGSQAGSAPNVVIVEPALQVTKAALPTTGDAGDTITFTVTITNGGASNAEAFDVAWSDVIPTGMTYTPGTLEFTGVGVPPSSLVDAAAPTLTATWDSPATSFPIGSNSHLTFDVTLDASVSPGQVITNTTTVAWTSLPGDVTTAQSAYNNLSTERTGDTSNPGGAENDYRATGTAIVTVASTPTKSIRLTSEAHTGFVSPNERVAIGEIVRYRLMLQLPEGTAIGFQLQDALPAGMLFLDDNTATAALVSNGGVPPAGGISSSTLPAVDGGGNPLVVTGDQTTIAGIIPLYVLPDDAVSSDFSSRVPDVYNNGTDPYFWFGTLVNYDRDVDQEFVLVEFNALTMNVTGNQSNTLLNNQFRPRVNNVNGTLSSAVGVRVAEPVITNLSKIVSTVPEDAGDTIVYSLTYGNTASGANAAAAFDIRLTDVLDANLELVSVAVSAPGYAVVTDNSNLITDVVDVTVDRLNPGDSVTVTINAQVIDTAAFGATIPNTANLTYTSLPGPNGTTPNPTGSTTPGASGAATGERNGSGAPLNDYFDSAAASVALSDPAVSKSIFATSVSTTGSGEFDPTVTDLVIGETVTFHITATLPEGDGPITIIDNLPTAPNGTLGVISSQVVSLGASLSGSLLSPGDSGVAADVNLVDGIDDRVTFGFGTIHNEPDGVSDAGDQIVVEVVALLENVADNQNGDSLTNSATIDFGTGTDTATAEVEAVEPVLQATKSADDDTPAFGQSLTYSIVVSHTGASAASAFDVRVTDPLVAGLDLQSVAVAAPGYAVVTDNSNLAADIVDVTLSRLDPGDSATLTLGVVVADYPAVSIGDALLNTTSLTWTSLAGVTAGERDGSGGVNDYASTASETVTVSGPDLQITKDDGGATSSAGGVIAYTLAYINVGNTDAEVVTITDTVPANTTFNAGASSAGWVCAPDVNPGSVCSLDVGTVGPGAGDSVTFAVTVDNPLAAGVTQISNTAAITDDGTNGPEPTPADNTDSDTTPVTAVPDLTIGKDDGRSIVSGGVTLVYVLTYTNAGQQDSTGVELTDTVPTGTTFLPGSSTPGWSCTPNNNAGSLCTYAVGDLPVSSGGSVSFAVLVDDPLDPGISEIANTAVIADDGNNGPDANPADNSDDDVDSTWQPGAFTKALDSTNQSHTAGLDAAIGEILTYEITIVVPPGSAAGTTIHDTLDRGLAFVACTSLTPSSIGLSTSVGTFADVCDNPTVATEPPGSPDPADPGRLVTFDLAMLTNSDQTDATLTLVYDVVVLDSVQNERGVALQNGATLTWDDGVLSGQAPAVTLVEPTLTLSKIAAPTVALPGADITFTLTIVHSAASDSHAFDLVLQDVVPVGLTYVPGSLSSVSGQAPTTLDDSGAPALMVRWDSFLDNGVNAVIEFHASLDNLGAGSSVTNSSLLEWSSLPGDFSSPQSTFNDLSTERFYDPGSAVDVYGVTATATISVPALPATGFAPGRRTELPAAPEGFSYTDLGGLRLEVPDLSVDIPIVGVPRSGDGWDLTWLSNAAGYLEGTAFPTLPGNSALTAHVYLADGTPGPFVHLDRLVWGDEIHVVSGDVVFVYSVRQVSHVQPENLHVLRHEELPWLTLITCERFDQAREAYARRVVVRAVLVDVHAR